MSMDRNNADIDDSLQGDFPSQKLDSNSFGISDYDLPASGYFNHQTEDLHEISVPMSTAQFIFKINLSKLLILAKIFATLVFLIALGKPEILFFVFMLTFEYFGYYGSSHLKYKCKLVFMSYLLINTLVRIASVWYYFTLIDDFSVYFQVRNLKTLLSQVNSQYILGSLLFIYLEILQFVLSVSSAKIMASLTDNKARELEFFIKKQNFRSFCLRKTNLK